MPGFPEAVSFEECNHIKGLSFCMVVRVGLSRRDVSDGAEQAMVIEPIDPAQVCHFHKIKEGVMRPTAAQLGALLEVLNWRRVHGGWSEPLDFLQ